MCGRVIQSSGPLRYAILEGMDVRDNRVHNYPARWNGAPSQDLLVIRRNTLALLTFTVLSLPLFSRLVSHHVGNSLKADAPAKAAER